MGSNKINRIFIRKEIFQNEFRCPIIPTDIQTLISYGFIVYVESCNNRCYKDEEYINNGAIVVIDSWVNYNDFIILGIKNLYNIELLNNSCHIYFSHSYKNQLDSQYILNMFKKTNSILYDLEYFIENNQRIITFGYYAGVVGSSLGLIQYYLKLSNKKLINLNYWNSINDLYLDVKKYIDITNIPSICIIGPNGNCGNGVKYILNLLNIPYTSYGRNDNKYGLEKYDIIYNCISLNEKINIWFDNDTIFNKNLVICDISCDYNNSYNPIKIYNNKTTWTEPIYSYNKFVDIIAIDNLPSLIPSDSSIEFSSKMLELLKNFNDDKFNHWINNYNIFIKHLKNIL